MTCTGAPAAGAVDLVETYGSGDTRVTALDGGTVSFATGAFSSAIVRPSGSGTSTLMPVRAGVDSATSGEVRIGETALSGLKDKGLTASASSSSG